jgi:hypothetical protein
MFRPRSDVYLLCFRIHGKEYGIELIHRLKKQQMMVEIGDEGLTAAERFYALAS